MSEMELSVFRQRSIEAMKQKARRGELFLTVAVGYVKTGRDLIEKDPDRRVQEAIGLVFRRYAELQSIRQVLVWLMPIRLMQTPATCRVHPRAGIKVGIGRRLNPARDAEQRAEGVERVEPSVEAERELIEVGL